MDNHKGVVEFVHCFGLGQLVVLYEVSSVLVDDGVEEHLELGDDRSDQT